MCRAVSSVVETVKIIDSLLAGFEVYMIVMCIVQCERIGLICEMYSVLQEKVYYVDVLIMKSIVPLISLIESFKICCDLKYFVKKKKLCFIINERSMKTYCKTFDYCFCW